MIEGIPSSVFVVEPRRLWRLSRAPYSTLPLPAETPSRVKAAKQPGSQARRKVGSLQITGVGARASFSSRGPRRCRSPTLHVPPRSPCLSLSEKRCEGYGIDRREMHLGVPCLARGCSEICHLESRVGEIPTSRAWGHVIFLPHPPCPSWKHRELDCRRLFSSLLDHPTDLLRTQLA